MKEIALLEAKCADCGLIFSHPSLGDFSYGEAVLCTADGQNYATVDGFCDFAQRLKSVAVSGPPGGFWSLIASFADPIAGQSLTASTHCPKCASRSLEYWGGQRTGTASVPPATFASASLLSLEALAKAAKVHRYEA
jgi:hypothetical protein